MYTDEVTYFLTGDATYSQELVDREVTDGVNGDPLTAVETLRKIRELAKQMPLVVLPAHHGDGVRRKDKARSLGNFQENLEEEVFHTSRPFRTIRNYAALATPILLDLEILIL
jgi:glyoxylase-like metal-dependent hydrolase (beta-lactamase superfamily II)